ncbi:MAG: NTP transferase domain-containing protein [Elusimicrobia bacterium]|nr:NTP transferase domain-containing protein [Elusimicrobiota bacterium]
MSARECGRWGVVLSGGDGERMQPFIRRWLGHPRPKQYCAFTGRRTMLEHTFDRAVSAAGSHRVVTVVNDDHHQFLQSPRRLEAPGRLIVQPRRCDTGPGVFLPLTVVMARDPEAVVAIMPSDHFIHPKERFQSVLDEAFRLAELLPGQLVLMAAEPDAAEPDYGWIAPGTRLSGSRASLVSRFKEKPGPEEAEAMHRRGCLWNTMIVVARAAALWQLARSLRPVMMARFEALRPWIGMAEEAEAVDLAYRAMPTVNFSRDILEQAADWAVVLPMRGVHWSDWGRPERVEHTLRAIGARSALPAAALGPALPEAALA